MKKRDMESFKKVLLKKKGELLKEVLINDQDANADSAPEIVKDLADQASEAYDRELASSLSETERRFLISA